VVSGEFERVAELRRRLAFASDEVELGIGDDAAVLAHSDRKQVLSVDAQVEGVHFERRLLAASDIGYRAFVAALSDLAAMGAQPRAALIALILPPALGDEELYALVDGIAEAQREHVCAVVGGNLARGGELSITTSVLGDAPSKPLTRAGAQPGHGLFVTGELGSAALGLLLLQAGKPDLAPHSVARWRRPSARVRQGQALVDIASCCIDVSDGLLQDLGHLSEASGMGFEIELDRLPIAAELFRVAPILGLEPSALALGGGEDYELLFTADPQAPSAGHGTRIGTAVRAPGLRLVDAQGRSISAPSVRGFEHFTRG
jgi:thiamine-monophosphate kinase